LILNHTFSFVAEENLWWKMIIKLVVATAVKVRGGFVI